MSEKQEKLTFSEVIFLFIVVIMCSLIIFGLFKKESEYIGSFPLSINKDTELYQTLSNNLNKVESGIDYTIGKLDGYESILIAEDDSLYNEQARYKVIHVEVENNACPFMNVSLDKEGIIVKPLREKKSEYTKSFVEKCAIEIIKNVPTEKIDTQQASIKERINSWN